MFWIVLAYRSDGHPGCRRFVRTSSGPAARSATLEGRALPSRDDRAGTSSTATRQLLSLSSREWRCNSCNQGDSDCIGPGRSSPRACARAQALCRDRNESWLGRLACQEKPDARSRTGASTTSKALSASCENRKRQPSPILPLKELLAARQTEKMDDVRVFRNCCILLLLLPMVVLVLIFSTEDSVFCNCPKQVCESLEGACRHMQSLLLPRPWCCSWQTVKRPLSSAVSQSPSLLSYANF